MHCNVIVPIIVIIICCCRRRHRRNIVTLKNISMLWPTHFSDVRFVNVEIS